MAQPIALEIPPRDARKELLTRLENAPAEHAEALVQLLALMLPALHRPVTRLVHDHVRPPGQLAALLEREVE